MNNNIGRREFIQQAGIATVGIATVGIAGLAGAADAATAAVKTTGNDPKRPIRVGVVGLGGRGFYQVRLLNVFDGVTVAALCDLKSDRVARAKKHLLDAGQPAPHVYGNGADDYKRMFARDDLHAVIISTPWDWHARMAVAAMKAGKFTGVETPIALTLDECWDVVRTHESSGAGCMMFENWAFRRDNLAVLNMIRAGLFGRIVHGHCSYSHNCLHWGFSPQRTWFPPHLKNKNVSQYSTHGMGPMIAWMDINSGDHIDYITSMASKSLGINEHLRRQHGADSPLAKETYKQGDIVTTMLRTVQGKTMVVNCDIQLPRPYNNRWMIQGTQGIYNEQRAAVYIEGTSPKNATWEPFAPYEKKYDHRFWKNLTPKQRTVGHGGTDFVVMNEFLRAVRTRQPAPLSVYDAIAMCVINPLSGESIANGSQPVKCPDFTGGKWESGEGRFAVDG